MSPGDMSWKFISACWFPTAQENSRALNWSASKMNFDRNKTSQDRLNMLSLLSIEHELLQSVSFTDVINDFAVREAR